MVVVTASPFARRLLDLTRGGGAGPSRRAEDRHLLFKSAALMIPSGEHAETEVNACLMRWLAATRLVTDYVSWRRYLVDAGYLIRDRARSHYQLPTPDPEATGVRFEPEVNAIDVESVMAEGRRAEDARRIA